MSASLEFLCDGTVELDPQTLANDVDTCPICRTEFLDEDSDVPVRIIVCGHIFCFDCLITHVLTGMPNSSTCPMCRHHLFDRSPADIGDPELTELVHEFVEEMERGIDAFTDEPDLIGLDATRSQEFMIRYGLDLADALGVDGPGRVHFPEWDPRINPRPSIVPWSDDAEVDFEDEDEGESAGRYEHMQDFENDISSDQGSSGDFEDSDDEMA